MAIIDIVANTECYFASLYQALDTVAREKKYLAFTEAPPVETAYAFYRNIIENKLCQRLAIANGGVVGWCDILPVLGEARSHVGALGIALMPSFRHQGVGARLMKTTLACARERGLSRIELNVRADNVNARKLYERFGFVEEGMYHGFFRIDEQYFDAFGMALCLPHHGYAQEKMP